MHFQASPRNPGPSRTGFPRVTDSLPLFSVGANHSIQHLVLDQQRGQHNQLKTDYLFTDTKCRMKPVESNLKAYDYQTVYWRNDQSTPHEDQLFELPQSLQ